MSAVYNLHYQYEFQGEPPPELGVAKPWYRVSFLRRNYTGSQVSILAPHDNPYRSATTESGDSRFALLNPEKLTFELLCDSALDAQGFYVKDDRELQVRIDVDYTGTRSNYEPHKMGWVLPTDLKEPYGPKPYIVSVSASDGLSTLKDYPFIDENGKRLTGMVSLSQALRVALNQTGLTSQLVTGINLYEAQDMATGQTLNGLASPARDTLYQLTAYADTFIADNGVTLTCWDGLVKVLSGLNLRLSQIKGNWYVLRASECAGGWDVWNSSSTTSMHTRTHDSVTLSDAPTTHGSIDLNVAVNMTGPVRALSGGLLWPQATKPGVKVEQSFGRYINKLPNGNFNSFDSTGFPTGLVRQNTPATGINRPHVVGLGTESSPFGLYIYGAGNEKFNRDTPCVGWNLTYPPGSIERIKTLKRTIKGRFSTQNVRGGKLFIQAVREGANRPPEVYILKTSGSWTKDPGAKDSVGLLIYHTLTDTSGHLIAKPGYADINIDLPPLDGISQLSIMLCAGEALDKFDGNGHRIGANTGPPDPYVIYENLRMEVAVEGIAVDGQQRTRVIPPKIAQTVLSFSLGDVPDLAQASDRIGTLFYRTNSVPAARFYRPDANILAPNPIGNDLGRPLIDYLTDEYAGQLTQPGTTWEGTLTGLLPYGYHSVLRFFDIGETAGGSFQPYPLQLARIESDYRTCQHTVTAERIMPDNPALPATKREWQTPDGPIPMDLDAAGTVPIDPTLAQHQSLRDVILGVASGLQPVPKLTITYPTIPGFVPAAPADGPRLKLTVKNGNIVIGIGYSSLRGVLKFHFS